MSDFEFYSRAAMGLGAGVFFVSALFNATAKRGIEARLDVMLALVLFVMARP